MNKLTFLTGTRGNAAAAVFRSCAFFLALIITCHVLPFSFFQEDYALSSTQTEASFSFEPVQVCDDGSGMMSFLADHPWVTSSVPPALYLPDGTCCPPPLEREFAEGVPSAVYRPPRTILS